MAYVSCHGWYLRFGKKVNSHMIIALHIALLVQSPEKSGWLPYLRLLPKKFDTMPVRYPPELLELLPQNAQGKGCRLSKGWKLSCF